MDLELNRIAGPYRGAALKRPDTIAEGFPRLLYVAILSYIGLRIVGCYAGRMKDMQEIQKH